MIRMIMVTTKMMVMWIYEATLAPEDDQHKHTKANTLGAHIKIKANEDGDNDDDRDTLKHVCF